MDYDHDGDLDLFVTGAGVNAGEAPNTLWRNNGNGTFSDWTVQVGLGGQGKTKNVLLSDINNDRAVDLIVTGDSGFSHRLPQSPRRQIPDSADASIARPGERCRCGRAGTMTKTAGWILS